MFIYGIQDFHALERLDDDLKFPALQRRPSRRPRPHNVVGAHDE